MDRTAGSRRSLRALDALALLAPDVQGGVGPFLVVYMAATLGWDAGRVGSVMFISAIAGLLLQVPAGAWIDRVRCKPCWLAASLGLIAVSVLAMAQVPSYPVLLVAQSIVGGAGAMIGPGLAAVSLGLVGRSALDARVGRNTALTAAGTTAWALCTGFAGRLFGPWAMFAYATLMALPAIAAALSIRNVDIDPRLARGADAPAPAAAAAGRWCDRRLLVLCACAFLFHLANAALLTLVAQEISLRSGARAPLLLSASLVITQLMTLGIGCWVSRCARGLPRKPVFLAAFLVLPLRALLYLGTGDPLLLVGLQVLDGIGAGVFGAMQLLMVSDLTRGSGHFSLGQSVVATAVGAGAACSNLLAGLVAKSAGYDMAFLVLAVLALLALLLFSAAMPETRGAARRPLAVAAEPLQP
jgi:predicted MFS family arabinose efflux permease